MMVKHLRGLIGGLAVVPMFSALMLSAPAFAEGGAWCQELWLARNTVMDRAGQCFRTPLGQAVFDNSDCIAGERPLTPLDQHIITEYLSLEEQSRCDVDTSATRLDPIVEDWWRDLQELWTIPIRADSEHGCIGYTGPVRELRAGMSNSTTLIGYLRPGDNFGFGHRQMPGGWEYIGVSDAEYETFSHGWVQGIEMTEDVCETMAG